MTKTIFISDFDDTLVKTDAKVIVIHGDGKKEELNPAQFAVYEPRHGDQFDYSQFNQLINPRPIPRYVRLLKRAIESKRINKIVILTARGSEKPVVKFLRSVGITQGVKIVALGDNNPERKKQYIERQIQKGYSNVIFADDSPKNVNAARELRTKYPGARLIVHQAKEKRERKEKIKQQLKPIYDKLRTTYMKNPLTGRDIQLRTALSYDTNHPIHHAAIQKLQQLKNG